MARPPTRKSGRTGTPQKTSDSLGAFVFMRLRRLMDLERVLCIRYPTTFREKSVSALLDSGSEVNAFWRRSTATFAKELGFRIRPGAPWDAFRCQSAKNRRYHAGYLWNGSRSILGDGQGKSSKILWKTFLVANVSPEVVFGMLSSPWVVQTLISWIGNSAGGLVLPRLIPPRRPSRLLDASS